MTRAYPTQEIGSLPKFGWRAKPFRQTPLDDGDIRSAAEWGATLGVSGWRGLVRTLSKRGGFTSVQRQAIVDASMRYAIAMQETAGRQEGADGIDLVWSGEQARTEMYETPVANIGGFEFIGRVRSWDNKYWRIASVRKKPSFQSNYHLAEFEFVRSHTRRPAKVPITDAVTIMAWSDHYYYTRKWSRGGAPVESRAFSARREFTLDLAGVIRRVIRGLADRGAREFQLDIPAATQYQSKEDIGLLVEAFNETTKGIDAKFSVHSCFPTRVGYGPLFPHILEMKKCSRFSFEYANRDTYSRGQGEDARRGYSDLRLFRDNSYSRELGVGVVHVHTDRLPSVEVVRDRVLYATKTSGLPPENIFVNPDCGLRTRTPAVAYSMLGLVASGARAARKELGD